MTKKTSRKNNSSRKQSKGNYFKFNNDIKGIIFITIGILMILSIFVTNASGIAGQTAKRILISLMGIGAYFFPVILIFLGISFIMKNGKINFNKRFYGIFLFVINSLLFIQMIYMDEYYKNETILYGIKKIYSEDKIMHGGITSYLIDIPIYKLFGNIGAYIIFTAVYIIAFILISQISLMDLINNFKINNFKISNDKKITKTEDSKENLNDIMIEENNTNQQSFIKNLNDKLKVIDFMKSTEYPEERQEIQEPKIIDNVSSLHYIENKPRKSDILEEISAEKINDELNSKLIENNEKEKMEYTYPTLDLLNLNSVEGNHKNNKKELISIASRLEETLSSFGVEAKVIQVTKGPSVTRFELQPNAGVKVSKITHLADDIALSLAASSIRIEAPIPGKSAVGIEVPNKSVSPVYLREVLEDSEFKTFNKNIAFALGKDIGGNCIVADLSKMPHLLIAGATGSGKSVCINTLIISLLYKYSPDDVKLLLVDPKVVELSIYNDIPHLLIPVVTNPKKAAGALNWAVNEMTRRYTLFANNNVRNIEGYNELCNKGKIEEKLPWIVIVIDELADLMMVCPGEVEEYICRLAQMARAAGMHLVIATQRPSVNVITGVIKANIPSRISFAVSSQIDSRTILDSAGAEKLLGRGDMLFYPVGESKPIRIQGAFIAEEEVEKVVNFIKTHKNDVKYEEKIIEEINTNIEKKNSSYDELLDEAINIVVEIGQASTSLLQRKLRIGYNRAARIIDELEEKGIISGRNGSKPRQVLINKKSLDENN
ncbi:FtsK/SpoIIIE family DNA translocase [Clostridium sp. ZS2-4]|uniref:FtsK/SpoIIIE family DNA translocase n=1 Tax=Clostridium sp. ZS2-4 TaxID=2987703 RepID=UPI00227A6CAB|nr:DNA translocase FtsK [Clostridium sp. ZS2-4]MCY6356649.1 DNA translocase FtsK [Clostridium sp. ZS2-4]